jgi:hypothetical protein
LLWFFIVLLISFTILIRSIFVLISPNHPSIIIISTFPLILTFSQGVSPPLLLLFLTILFLTWIIFLYPPFIIFSVALINFGSLDPISLFVNLTIFAFINQFLAILKDLNVIWLVSHFHKSYPTIWIPSENWPFYLMTASISHCYKFIFVTLATSHCLLRVSSCGLKFFDFIKSLKRFWTIALQIPS